MFSGGKKMFSGGCGPRKEKKIPFTEKSFSEGGSRKQK
jgi:hypothetical protein